MPEPVEPSEPNESEDLEGWLTADDACSALGGISPATLTRAAQQRVVRRKQDPTSSRPRYLYDPETVEEARQSGVLTPNPAGENLLNGGANTIRATNDLVLRLADKLLGMVDRVTTSYDASTRSAAALQEAMLAQFRRADERAAKLEQAHLDFIRAREELVDQKHARELETKQVERSLEVRDKALQALIEQAPAFLELWTEFERSKRAGGLPPEAADVPEEPAVVETEGEPC